MGLVRWFTKNWAATGPATHPDLRPLVLPLTPPQAAAAVRDAVRGMRLWRVAEETGGGGLHLTRTTRLFRFVDDVRVRFEPAPGGTAVNAESRSRVGVGDLGQNRHNILELWRAVARQAGSTDAPPDGAVERDTPR